jgi:hypothetical protein
MIPQRALGKAGPGRDLKTLGKRIGLKAKV